MKTTIELPDELAREAREVARAGGTTLKELVVEGLRSEVVRRSRGPARVDLVYPVTDGGLGPGIDPHRLLDYAYENEPR